MSAEALKHCPGCDEDWPADTAFFHKLSRGEGKLTLRCKACSARPKPVTPQHHITDCLQGLLTGLLHQGARA